VINEWTPSLALLGRLGTLSHNRTFTKQEWIEYGGSSGELAKLRREKLVAKIAHRQYFPTSRGWRALDLAAREL
jgi:hypothetical protein